jgi:RimJ/RimL family protein N-acetyltransferase
VDPIVRPLDLGDWAELRRVRLEALRSEPGAFHSNYAREAAHADNDWRDLIVAPSQRLFGLFVGGALVGISAVFTDRNDPSGRTALFGMSYIQPDYRGRGYAALLHRARLDWTRTQPQFRIIRVSHRASNAASGRAIVRSGFACVGRETRVWPDGVAEDELLYEMPIVPPGPPS